MWDPSKRAQLFTWLKLKHFDTVFLQETHCNGYKDSKLWEKEWADLAFGLSGVINHAVLPLCSGTVSPLTDKCYIMME